MTTESLNEFLAGSLMTLRKQNNGITLDKLAQLIGVSKSTIDRIGKKEVKNPSITHGLKIVQATYGEDKYPEFLKNCIPFFVNIFSNVTDISLSSLGHMRSCISKTLTSLPKSFQIHLQNIPKTYKTIPKSIKKKN